MDAQGHLWIGTYPADGSVASGLAQFDGEHWTVYTTENSGLQGNDIRALACDVQGNLWIGTRRDYRHSGGLAKFDGQYWTVYTTENSGLPSNEVNELTFDAQGNLWIGTLGGGVAVYREGGVMLPDVRE